MMYNVAYLCRHIIYICENPTFLVKALITEQLK